ncbi:MAG: succinate dehydrogenase [Rhizobiaceae bacterium]
MISTKLYLMQRLSAMLMAPLVFVHIGVMIYAAKGGLSAVEILSRTQGSIGWMFFYGTFVVAVSVHAAIGLRVIVFETFKFKGRGLLLFTWGVFLVLLSLGLRAVYAVTAVGLTL